MVKATGVFGLMNLLVFLALIVVTCNLQCIKSILPLEGPVTLPPNFPCQRFGSVICSNSFIKFQRYICTLKCGQTSLDNEDETEIEFVK